MMEHSLNSCMGKEAVSEESGWTSYFQDLSQGMMMKEQSYCLSFGGGSSLVSDASSSSAAWKKFSSTQQHNHNHNHDHHLVSCSSVKKPTTSSLPKKLCFKKTRAKQISQEDDDPLEDTASSPLNSPKVGDLNSTETISRNNDYQLGSSVGNNKGFESELQQTDEGGEVNFDGKKKNIDECNDLKKRGLCLVPFSMLVNYYG